MKEPRMPVHPQAQAVLDLLEQFGVTQLSDFPVEQARALVVQMDAETPRPDVAEVRDVTIPGPGGDVRARLYRPHGSIAADV